VYDLYVWNSFSPHFVDYVVSGHEERMAIFPFANLQVAFIFNSTGSHSQETELFIFLKVLDLPWFAITV